MQCNWMAAEGSRLFVWGEQGKEYRIIDCNTTRKRRFGSAFVALSVDHELAKYYHQRQGTGRVSPEVSLLANEEMIDRAEKKVMRLASMPPPFPSKSDCHLGRKQTLSYGLWRRRYFGDLPMIKGTATSRESMACRIPVV